MPEVTPICQFGTKAISFSLKGIDEKTYNLEKIKGENGENLLSFGFFLLLPLLRCGAHGVREAGGDGGDSADVIAGGALRQGAAHHAILDLGRVELLVGRRPRRPACASFAAPRSRTPSGSRKRR